jgi:hypothetical protein
LKLFSLPEENTNQKTKQENNMEISHITYFNQLSARAPSLNEILLSVEGVEKGVDNREAQAGETVGRRRGTPDSR